MNAGFLHTLQFYGLSCGSLVPEVSPQAAAIKLVLQAARDVLQQDEVALQAAGTGAVGSRQ